MSTWEKDWDNSNDAIYDIPDEEQLAAAAKRKAMREYMDWSMEVEDAIIKSIGQEEYDAREHWINNPLIKPQSKVHLFEEWEQRIRKEQNERIIKLLDEHKQTTKSVGGFLGVCSCGKSIDDYSEHLIALIKGENK
jgi:hypothetical protein